jgi:hypothetical protein
MMPEQPAPNDPNGDEVNQWLNRWDPEMREMFEKVHRMVREFPGIQRKERADRFSYRIDGRNPKWITIWTHGKDLELVIRVKAGDLDLEPSVVAKKLGVIETDVTENDPKDLDSIKAKIMKGSDPDSAMFRQFLRDAYHSMLKHWS